MSTNGPIQVPKEEYQQYQNNKAEYTKILQKIRDLELVVAEHKDVLATLSKMEPTRRCLRVVDHVLVERDVQQVRGAVEIEKENIMKAMGNLNTQSRKLEESIIAFETKYGIAKAPTK